MVLREFIQNPPFGQQPFRTPEGAPMYIDDSPKNGDGENGGPFGGSDASGDYCCVMERTITGRFNVNYKDKDGNDTVPMRPGTHARLAELHANPPPAGWGGVVHRTPHPGPEAPPEGVVSMSWEGMITEIYEIGCMDYSCEGRDWFGFFQWHSCDSEVKALNKAFEGTNVAGVSNITFKSTKYFKVGCCDCPGWRGVTMYKKRMRGGEDTPGGAPTGAEFAQDRFAELDEGEYRVKHPYPKCCPDDVTST